MDIRECQNVENEKQRRDTWKGGFGKDFSFIGAGTARGTALVGFGTLDEKGKGKAGEALGKDLGDKGKGKAEALREYIAALRGIEFLKGAGAVSFKGKARGPY